MRQGAGQGVCKLFLLKLEEHNSVCNSVFTATETHMDTESLRYIIRRIAVDFFWFLLYGILRGQWISGSLYYTEMRGWTDSKIGRSFYSLWIFTEELSWPPSSGGE